ncbi:ATP-binding protein [Methylomarinum vadi]|uniref:ATP-binding protein n=1 Tax=Methylomarinum vadi TaxID=438855 RepID=UPI0004DF7C0B|nr:ATP-binding protein [Methylomarinum vadi]
MSDEELQIDVVIPTQTRYLDLIGNIAEHIGKELQQYSGDREAFAYHLNLVLTEATSNAIRHSSHNDPSETVRITIQLIGDELNIKVYDHGQGFDLEQIPLPDLDHPKEGGMGIFFIRSLMDSVTYTKREDCNVLEIKKLLKPNPGGS